MTVAVAQWSQPADSPNLQREVNTYLQVKDWSAISDILSHWDTKTIEDRAKLTRILAKSLTDKTLVRLENTSDLIIPYRIGQGDIPSNPSHGVIITQDLFIVAGRAACGIEYLSGANLRLPTITAEVPVGKLKRYSEYCSHYPDAMLAVDAYMNTREQLEITAFLDKLVELPPLKRGVYATLMTASLSDATAVPVNIKGPLAKSL